jgi:choline dehydrogenase-like flavoprotein
MLGDGRRIQNGERLVADVCVIGAGAAGITICKELLNSNLEVILLEAGGLGRSKVVQSFYDGETLSPEIHAPPSMYRQRRFGGSTTIWGGRCVPLDAIDFESRAWIPGSGWPFSRAAVDPYYQRAMPYFEAGEFIFDEKEALAHLVPLVEGYCSDLLDTTTIERFSAPTDFGRVHGPQLIRASRIKVVINASCLELVIGSAENSISHAQCTSLSKNSFRIEAKTYVVAAGGLETTRLLLASNSRRQEGIGNENGLLGRNYMCHIESMLSELRLTPRTRPVVWDFERARDGAYVKRRFRVADAQQREKRTLNSIFRLHHANPADSKHGSAVLSAMFLVKHLIIPEYRRKIAMVEYSYTARTRNAGPMLAGHLGNVVRNAPELARFSVDWIVRRYLTYRRVPYVAIPSRDGVYPIDFNSEQSPNPNSRVFLSNVRDLFGTQKLVVDWRMDERDVHSIVESHVLFASAVAASGLGTLQFFDDDIEAAARSAVPVGGHHIGTARMDTNPKLGVVDSNCRLHSAENIYVASSAAFPTSGQANPTLTIVALAIRLADHLRYLHKSRSGSSP